MSATQISLAPGPETMRLGNERGGGKLQVGCRPSKPRDDLRDPFGCLFSAAIIVIAFLIGLSLMQPEVPV